MPASTPPTVGDFFSEDFLFESVPAFVKCRYMSPDKVVLDLVVGVFCFKRLLHDYTLLPVTSRAMVFALFAEIAGPAIFSRMLVIAAGPT